MSRRVRRLWLPLSLLSLAWVAPIGANASTNTAAGPPPLPPGKAKPSTPSKGGEAPAPRNAAPPPPPTSTPPPPSKAGGTAAEPSTRIEPKDIGPPVDLSETWGYARRSTPRPRYVRRTSDPVFYAPNPIGYYSGVSVAGNQTPPHPAPKLGTKPSLLTWTGFERTANGSRVFVQLSSAPNYSISQKGSTITIRLRNTKVNVRNNLRRLDLSYFKTPVRSVRVRRKGRDAVLTIVLKNDTPGEAGVVDGKAGSGYKLLVVDFNHGVRSNPAPSE